MQWLTTGEDIMALVIAMSAHGHPEGVIAIHSGDPTPSGDTAADISHGASGPEREHHDSLDTL